MSEIQTILSEAMTRSSQLDTIIRIGIACDIAELMAELDGLLGENEEADYVRDNDVRYDIWGFNPADTMGEMNWRLSVLCGESV